MRRRPGIQGLQRTEASRAQYRQLGASVAESRREVLRSQVATFREALERFALRHREQIRADPDFRARFHAMCSAVGVDPLVSNKGAWSRALGFGDYYFGLAVQVLESCRASRPVDGGLSDLVEVRRRVQARRGSQTDPITNDDVRRAVESLASLGGGLAVVRIGDKDYIRSVPRSLSSDAAAAIAAAAVAGGALSASRLAAALSWPLGRARSALEALLLDGVAMLDAGANGEGGWDDDPAGTSGREGWGDGAVAAPLYWVPAVGVEEAIRAHVRAVAERKQGAWPRPGGEAPGVPG